MYAINYFLLFKNKIKKSYYIVNINYDYLYIL